MRIENKKTYSFNLPDYCGSHYVSVDVVLPKQITQITFYTSSGKNLLFSVNCNDTALQQLNNITLAFIKAQIDETI